MAWQEPFISKSIFMKKIILFISLPILLALLNVLCYLLLQPPKTKEGRESVYSFLPGKMLAIKDNLTQRRLLEKTDQGYRVQEFYGVYPATAPFVIKNKEDLTKGIGYGETDTGDRFDTIGSVEGEITLYYQTNRVPWMGYRGSSGFEHIDPYIQFQWLKFKDKPYQQTLPTKLQLTYQDGKRQGQQIAYYKNGQRANVANYQNGLLEGPSTSWDENGNKRLEINFKNGLLNGAYTSWNPEGKLFISGTYEADQKQGAWTYRFTDGRQQKVQLYQQGKRLDTITINSDDTAPPTQPQDRIQCGLFNNKTIKIEGSDGSLQTHQVTNKNKDDCTRQLNTLYIDTKPRDGSTPLRFVLHQRLNDPQERREEAFTYTFRGKPFEKTKDPATGLWTIRQTAETVHSYNRYYWLEENGQLNYFIEYSSLGNLYTLYTNLSEYNAGLEIKSNSDSFLLQWPFIQERSRAFMRTHTIKNQQ